MRLKSVFVKCVKESIRDWKILLLTLIFGPLFIGVFYTVFSKGSTNYKIIISNSDKPVTIETGKSFSTSDEFTKLLMDKKNPDGSYMFKLEFSRDVDKIKAGLKNRKYDVGISIPEEFTQGLLKQIENPEAPLPKLNILGDLENVKYIVPALYINSAFETLTNSITGKSRSFEFIETAVIDYKDRTEFEASLPTGILLGVIMLLFSTAVALIKEVDAGTIRRLQISRVSSLEFMAAVSLCQLLIGIIIVLLSLLTAWSLGAKFNFSMPAVFLVSVLMNISCIAIGLLTAGFCKSVTDIMIIGNLPYFLLLVLSGAFPLPRVTLLTIGSHALTVNDILPTTPAITALKLIMDQGKGIRDILFEIVLIIITTVVYFIIGLALFNRKHMKLS